MQTAYIDRAHKLLAGLAGFPSSEQPLEVDIASLLGPLFFMWVMQILLPVGTISAYTLTHAHTFTHTHTHIYTHAYTHNHTCTPMCHTSASDRAHGRAIKRCLLPGLFGRVLTAQNACLCQLSMCLFLSNVSLIAVPLSLSSCTSLPNVDRLTPSKACVVLFLFLQGMLGHFLVTHILTGLCLCPGKRACWGTAGSDVLPRSVAWCLLCRDIHMVRRLRFHMLWAHVCDCVLLKAYLAVVLFGKPLSNAASSSSSFYSSYEGAEP